VNGRHLAFIAGSGMEALADAVAVRRAVRFEDIPGVGACGVEGHAGRVLEAAIDARPCTLVMGRRHVYEGDASAPARLVEWLAGSGVTHLVVASAAGALRRRLEPGDLVIVRDAIDVQNRYAGDGEARRGARGDRLHIDPDLAWALARAATEAGVRWQRGTMLCASGPAYETSAEVRAFQSWGGDVATMSGAPELAAAARAGIPAAAVALVTNWCTGIAGAKPNHEEVLAAGRRASRGLAAVVRQLVAE
jgi:inosine/guanosine/xanthosine phosphorylase family protein